MSKQNLSGIFRRSSYGLITLVVSFFIVLANFPLNIFIPTASAATTQFAWYYNQDQAAKVKLLQELKNGEATTGATIRTTKILVKNGPGSKDSVLNYDVETTNKYNVKKAVVGGDSIADDDSGEYFYSKWFYCGLDSKKIADTPPSDKKEKYVKMLYTVSIAIDGGDGAERMMDYRGFGGDDSHAGVTVANKITPAQSGSGGDATEKIYDHREGGAGTNDIDDDTDKIEPAQCRPGGRGDINVANYGKMSDSDKQSWKNLAETAAANPNATPSSADGGGDPSKTQPDCDAKWSSPLSWIICPVIDIGANLSDFVFKDIVAPLLKDVPITTDPGDPGFKAWQQFRIIGNVLLLGTLLAIVYSQARGGK